ncbi:hypothetical protein, partial [Rufibacter psychrotolerans]|uniref:hypothetical protein n=1 Tax=Rufibacter psychrotolerans TaxID=2812556 RepID=UPI001966F450
RIFRSANPQRLFFLSFFSPRTCRPGLFPGFVSEAGAKVRNSFRFATLSFIFFFRPFGKRTSSSEGAAKVRTFPLLASNSQDFFFKLSPAQPAGKPSFSEGAVKVSRTSRFATLFHFFLPPSRRNNLLFGRAAKVRSSFHFATLFSYFFSAHSAEQPPFPKGLQR